MCRTASISPPPAFSRSPVRCSLSRRASAGYANPQRVEECRRLARASRDPAVVRPVTRRPHGQATAGHERPGGVSPRLRLHGDQLRVWPGRQPRGRGGDHPRRRRRRGHLLRHRGSLWTVRERGSGRRSIGPGPRPRGDRNEVRLQVRRRQAGRVGQPAGAHPRGRRGLAQAAQDRSDRPLLPAPGRPGGPDRGRRRCRRRR